MFLHPFALAFFVGCSFLVLLQYPRQDESCAARLSLNMGSQGVCACVCVVCVCGVCVCVVCVCVVCVCGVCVWCVCVVCVCVCLFVCLTLEGHLQVKPTVVSDGRRG